MSSAADAVRDLWEGEGLLVLEEAQEVGVDGLTQGPGKADMEHRGRAHARSGDEEQNHEPEPPQEHEQTQEE